MQACLMDMDQSNWDVGSWIRLFSCGSNRAENMKARMHLDWYQNDDLIEPRDKRGAPRFKDGS